MRTSLSCFLSASGILRPQTLKRKKKKKGQRQKSSSGRDHQRQFETARMPLWTSRAGGEPDIYSVCVCVIKVHEARKTDKTAMIWTSNPVPSRQKICTNSKVSRRHKNILSNQNKREKKIFTIHRQSWYFSSDLAQHTHAVSWTLGKGAGEGLPWWRAWHSECETVQVSGRRKGNVKLLGSPRPPLLSSAQLIFKRRKRRRRENIQRFPLASSRRSHTQLGKGEWRCKAGCVCAEECVCVWFRVRGQDCAGGLRASWIQPWQSVNPFLCTCVCACVCGWESVSRGSAGVLFWENRD